MKLHTREQYLSTLKWIKMFEEDIKKMEDEGPPPDVHPRIWQACKDGMNSKMQDLIDSTNDYEKEHGL